MEPNISLGPSIPVPINLGKHYARAPIVEALIEFRCSPEHRSELTTLRDFVDLAEGFQPAETRVALMGQFELGRAGIKSSGSAEELGYMYRRSDGLRAVQALRDRFIFSWLKPYESWVPFEAEARSWWKRYVEVTGALQLAHLSVRFINQINIPGSAVEMQDYLRTNVDVSHYLPQMINGFFLQVAIPIAELDVVAQITSSLVPPPEDGYTSIVLDTEIQRPLALSNLYSSDTERALTEALADMHQAKNWVFEACITDATRSLIS